MYTKKFFLKNGLEVVLEQDTSVQIAVVNILYKVGSRNDPKDKTGMAHLLEHLMFCGTKNIKSYDKELQKVGGINNAYTDYDVTNYYCIVPANNVETALFLESDRMVNLNVTEESLNIQKNVVIEEMKERYYNSPYGDAFLTLISLIFPKNHPYYEPIIGKEEHIKSVTLQDISNFRQMYYNPDNAILTVVGNIDIDDTEKLVKKYFEGININFTQNACDCSCCSKFHNCEHSKIILDDKIERTKIMKKNIPSEAIYYAFKVPSRISNNFYTTTVLTEILNCGKSSIFHKKLVEEQKIFTSIDVEYISNIFAGILVISGFVDDKYTVKDATNALDKLLEILVDFINSNEVMKAKNNIKSNFFQELNDIKDRTDLLTNFINVGDSFENFENRINQVTNEQVKNIITNTLVFKNKSVLIFEKQNK